MGYKPRPFRTGLVCDDSYVVFLRQMIVLEFKAKGKTTQYSAIDEAIRTAQFVRNKCIRFWMDNRGVGQKELYRHNTALRAEFPFTKALNSHACQAANTSLFGFN